MPCESYGPSPYEEIQIRLNGFLDEIGDPTPKPGHSTCRVMTNDEMAQRLCAHLNSHQATRYSLELQIWWRDHQIADAGREAAEREERKRIVLVNQALAKLTPEERKALLGR